MSFLTLFKKNFKYWGKSFCTACELFTPIISALFLVYISFSSRVDKVDIKSYYLSAGTYGPPDPYLNRSFPQDYETHLQQLKDPRDQTYTVLKDCSSDEYQGGYIGLAAAESSAVASKLEDLLTLLGYSIKRFANQTQIFEFVESEDYGTKIDETGVKHALCFAISLVEEQNNKFVYKLHFNTTASPSAKDHIMNIDPQITAFQQEDDINLERIKRSGLILVKNMIDTAILKTVTGNNEAQIITRIAKMPNNPFRKSNVYTITSDGNIAIYVVFALLIHFLRFVYLILNEKEARITENLRNMGMGMLSHYFSWIFFYTLVLFVLSLVWAILASLTLFSIASLPFVFLLYFLTGWWLLSVGFFVSSFFVKTKSGVVVSLIIFLMFFGTLIVFDNLEDPSETVAMFFSLSPIVGMKKAAQVMLLLESDLESMSFGLLAESIQNFRFVYFLGFTFVQTLALFGLGMYVDQVWPSEIGVKKHPLFCCLVKKRNNYLRTQNRLDVLQNAENQSLKQHQENGNELELQHKYGDNYHIQGNLGVHYSARPGSREEELDPELILQKKNNQILILEKLEKKYGNGKVAVKSLTLDMYNGQVFVLLGHNGAGKSTTIGMISGLLPASGGKIEMMGIDTQADPDAAKKMIGVCPQVNPLYHNLTVKDHLYLYGNIKGSDPKTLDAQIDKILTDITLIEKKDSNAGTLSGGQKRMLCICIAFIGKSRIILLDEPTSGIDASSRRELWEMLKQYKKDKIMILTTHFMDEADFLGDRIGIMKNGTLSACGSSFFLKNKFGMGYDITIVKQTPETETRLIKDKIISIIPEANLTSQISMELKFKIPLGASEKFFEFFKMLEDGKETLGIQTFGTSFTTLEEVFLNLAVDSKKEKKEENIGSEGEENLDKIELHNNQEQEEGSQQDNQNEFEFIKLQKVVKQNSFFKKFCSDLSCLLFKRIRYLSETLKDFFARFSCL